MPLIDYTVPLDQLADPLPIEPLTEPFDVTITPPGSKSITCRAYVLAALAKGESKIIRPLRADDTEHLLSALCTLGAEARWEGDDVFIKGVGGRFPRGGNLYMGEGGTPTRFMIACACLAAEPVVIDASPRMRERPIAEGVDMLLQLGAKIEYVEAEERLPVRVVPSENFKGGEMKVGKTASSQFISALLLIAPFLDDGIEIEFSDAPTSKDYIDLTLRVLVDWQEDMQGHVQTAVPNKKKVLPIILIGSRFRVEPDASSAIYWILAACTAHGVVRIVGLRRHTAQPDNAIVLKLDIASMLARPTFDAEDHIDEWMNAAAADLIWSGETPLKWSFLASIDASAFPDGAVAMATVMTGIPETKKYFGLRTLRVKETDRIAALANELRKVGCTIETGEDWIEITPPVIRPPAEPGAKGFADAPIVIETYNDHRMAMAFAVLGLKPPNGVPLAIRNPKCVAKSYPGFWKDFAKLYQ